MFLLSDLIQPFATRGQCSSSFDSPPVPVSSFLSRTGVSGETEETVCPSAELHPEGPKSWFRLRMRSVRPIHKLLEKKF